MPLSHAVLFLGAYLVLAADEVPRFDYEATCRAPLLPSDQEKGLEQDCLNSHKRARSQLEQQWGQFSAAAKSRCSQASTLGAAPSYVELITCLENARDTNLDADRAPVTTTPPLRRP
jgi:hypothetical protein